MVGCWLSEIGVSTMPGSWSSICRCASLESHEHPLPERVKEAGGWKALVCLAEFKTHFYGSSRVDFRLNHYAVASGAFDSERKFCSRLTSIGGWAEIERWNPSGLAISTCWSLPTISNYTQYASGCLDVVFLDASWIHDSVSHASPFILIGQ